MSRGGDWEDSGVVSSPRRGNARAAIGKVGLQIPLGEGVCCVPLDQQGGGEGEGEGEGCIIAAEEYGSGWVGVHGLPPSALATVTPPNSVLVWIPVNTGELACYNPATISCMSSQLLSVKC